MLKMINNNKSFPPYKKPRLITLIIDKAIIDYIERCYHQRCPASITDIQNYLGNSFDFNFSPETLRFFLRQNPQWQAKTFSPIKDLRAQVSDVEINDYYQNLKMKIDGVPDSLVINIDESGFDKYEDARKRTLVIPAGSTLNKHGTARKEKRITLLGGICACIVFNGILILVH